MEGYAKELGWLGRSELAFVRDPAIESTGIRPRCRVRLSLRHAKTTSPG